MTDVEVPVINDLDASTIMGVGEGVQVSVYRDDPAQEPYSSNEMVRKVVWEMFGREGVTPDRDLNRLCQLAARIAIGQLAASRGFQIRFGRWAEVPRHVIDVDLRPEGPTKIQAGIERRSIE